MVQPREEFLGNITDLDKYGEGTITCNSAVMRDVNGILHTARASAPALWAASNGIFWVENTTPSLPKFTNSAGTTITLGTSAVTSVFTRTGVVTAQAGDYNTSQITNASTLTGATVTDALDNILSSIDGYSAQQEYDYVVVRNRAELVALFGPATTPIQIPAGTSVQIQGEIVLLAGETIVQDFVSGSPSIIDGLDPDYSAIIGDPATFSAIINMSDEDVVKNLRVVNQYPTSTVAGAAINTGVNSRIENCRLESRGDGYSTTLFCQSGASVVDTVIVHTKPGGRALRYDYNNPEISVSRCTIRGGESLIGSSIRFSECVFQKSTSGDQLIRILSSSLPAEVTFSDCRFELSGGSGTQYIEVADGDTIVVRGCEFGAGLTRAILVDGAGGVHIENSEFFTTNGVSFSSLSNDGSSVLGCEFQGGGTAISIPESNYNIRVSDNYAENVLIDMTEPCTGSVITGNNADVLIDVVAGDLTGSTITGNVGRANLSSDATFNATGFPDCIARGNIEAGMPAADFPAAATPTWAATLAAGNATAGGNNPEISDGFRVIYAQAFGAPPADAQVLAGEAVVYNTADLGLQSKAKNLDGRLVTESLTPGIVASSPPRADGHYRYSFVADNNFTTSSFVLGSLTLATLVNGLNTVESYIVALKLHLFSKQKGDFTTTSGQYTEWNMAVVGNGAGGLLSLTSSFPITLSPTTGLGANQAIKSLGTSVISSLSVENPGGTELRFVVTPTYFNVRHRLYVELFSNQGVV